MKRTQTAGEWRAVANWISRNEPARQNLALELRRIVANYRPDDVQTIESTRDEAAVIQRATGALGYAERKHRT
jgi:hypothetical protein